MHKWVRGLSALMVAFGLVSCGGGGGGGDTAPAVSLSPSPLTANLQPGVSTTLTVRATASDPSIFTGAVYVYVVDSAQVLTPSIGLSQVDARTFAATLNTAPGLASGNHHGTLQVQLCKDPNCVAQYPGSPVPLPYDLTVAALPLQASPVQSTTASVHVGHDLAQTVDIGVVGPDLAWTATTPAAWLSISGGTGRGAGSFRVGYATAALAVGHYTANVSVRTSDGQSSDVPFTLDVQPTQFTVDSGVPRFSAVNGASIATQTLSFELNTLEAAPWSATSSQPWLTLSPNTGTTPASLTLRADPRTGPLASGTYNADIVLASPGVPDRTVTAELTLTPPTLSAPAFSLTLGGTKGRDLTARTLPFSLNTDSNAWPWSLSALPAWLSSTTPNGTVSASGAVLSLASNGATGNAAGSVSETVNIQATVNGDHVTLPITVNLNADQRRLLPSTWGVGFASTPLAAVLTRTLSIADNFGGTLAWTATSDAAWLGATASGSTGGASTLTLTANPAALGNSTLSVASVTIATAAPGVEPAVVRVALWKSSSAPAALTRLPLTYSTLVADRIRPLVYAHNGGTAIDVYNAYTAQKVASIPAVATAALGRMAVSPDGSTLYALDLASTQAVAVVDLATLAKTTSWPVARAADPSTVLLAIRPNGVEIVLAGNGSAYLRNGHSLGTTPIFGSMAASDDGRKVFTQNSGISPASVAAYDVDFTAMSGGLLLVTNPANGFSINGSSNGQDIAVRGDGGALYVASGAPYRCSQVNPVDLSLVGSLPGGSSYPNNVEVGSDGRVLCGADAGGFSDDFWLHSSGGALLRSYDVTSGNHSVRAGQLVVTPDGLVAVALTDDPFVAFVPLGP